MTTAERIEAAAKSLWDEVNTAHWDQAAPKLRKDYLTWARRALSAADAAPASGVTEERLTLGGELDRFLEGMLHSHDPEARHVNAQALRQMLWDNKVGIIRCLQDAALIRGEVK